MEDSRWSTESVGDASGNFGLLNISDWLRVLI
jgi:hypothetical protein